MCLVAGPLPLDLSEFAFSYLENGVKSILCSIYNYVLYMHLMDYALYVRFYILHLFLHVC